ncbi:uncharacterized protein LOC129744266 [Uranotaenia lowii]|uniref:uncharacterized protein LOC129744266 n=1 Tax=Uranotaenia lowii TaxID=190385 RepID=UPI00247AE96F|nr:uncharacterized protein LOC129744266 [Uranotaenia lowii]
MDNFDDKDHCDSSMAASETSLYEDGPSAEKRLKFDDCESDSTFPSVCNEMQHAIFRFQEGARGPIFETNPNQQMPVAEYSEISSASEGYRTPSPDFTPNASHTSSPVPSGNPLSRSCSVIMRPTKITSTELIPSEEGEHNYAVHSPPSCGTMSGTEGSPPAMGLANHTVDSGNATLALVEEPLCVANWIEPYEMEERLDANPLVRELRILVERSNKRRERYMIARMGELPTSLDYNPNKSRLRKVYADPMIAAERERNNLASRKSRFKKKITQQITNLYLEYNRNENGILMAVMCWMKLVLNDLEKEIINRGITEQGLAQLRRQCGYQPIMYE